MTLSEAPKWPGEIALAKAKDTDVLLAENRSSIENRFKPGQLEDLAVATEQLSEKLTGQKINLVTQKSMTLGQGEAMTELRLTLGEIRDIIKAANTPAEILKAFGVGESFSNTVKGLQSAADLMLQGYDNHKDFARNEAGVLDSDMDEIVDLANALDSVDGSQERMKRHKKIRTMDKNTLQRTVEDLVTKVSKVGVKVFRKSDPAKAKLFADLIPSSGEEKKEEGEPQGEVVVE